jgi:hypothetical protein
MTWGEIAVLNFFGSSGFSIEKMCTTLVDPTKSLSLKGNIVSISNPTLVVDLNSGMMDQRY